MDPSPPATGAAAAKEPHLPTLCRVGNLVAPRAPQNIADAGLEDRALAGLAVSSGRSLFVYGPSGNGKSSVGRQIHAALGGDIWIPHCLAVGNTVIRVFDDQVHQRADSAGERTTGIDHRWVRVRRPLVVVGGE